MDLRGLGLPVGDGLLMSVPGRLTQHPPFSLDTKFLAQYHGRQPNWGPLGYVTYKRTYARRLNNGAYEEFWQTCQRVIEGTYRIQQTHCQTLRLPWNADKAQASAQEMFRRIWDFKFTPPGRGLWMMGTGYVDKIGGAALNNCAFVSTVELKASFSAPFCFLMDMSMLGVGVGWDTKGAGKVTIQEPIYSDKVFEVQDSREGWVDLVRNVLESYVRVTKCPKQIDYSRVRPAGSPIRTFGGTASGPGPLKELVESIHKVLRPLIGKPITSTAIADLFNLEGRCVVSGNVRRSAEIGFGDPNDTEFNALKDPTELNAMEARQSQIRQTILNMQVGEEVVNGTAVVDSDRGKSLKQMADELHALNQRIEEHPLRTHRWASNNSIFAKVGMDYSSFAERTASNGEPGYMWLDNAREYSRMVDQPDHKDHAAAGGNPCVPAGTRILTRDGYKAIDTLVDQDVVVWNGDQWSTVRPRVTGKDEPLVRVVLSDNTSLVCTEYHEWLIASGRRNTGEVRVRAQDLKPGDALSKYDMPVVEAGIPLPHAYTHGFFCGDGQTTAGGYKGALLYGVKIDLLPHLDGQSSGEPDKYGRVWKGFPCSIPDKFTVPHEADVTSKLQWFAGLLDADGCVVRNPNSVGIQLGSVNLSFLMDVRLMLTTLGVQAKVTKRAEEGMRSMPNGHGGMQDYFCQTAWVLNVNAEDTYRLVSLGLRTHRLDLPAKCPQRDARRFVTVESVEKCGVADVVYCFDEPLNHSGCFEGIITGQCLEQSLESFELCCVSGDTRILTRDGYPRIVDAVGKPVDVWNGVQWSSVVPFIAAKDKKLYRVHLSDGSYLDVTHDHAWSARTETQRAFHRVETSDLLEGMQLESCEPPPSEGGVACAYAYQAGWVAGDGFVDNDRVLALVQEPEYRVLPHLGGVPYAEQHPDKYTRPFRRVSLHGIVPLVLAKELRNHTTGLPEEVFTWSNESLSSFFGGWIDTDGCLRINPNTDHYVLHGSEAKLRDAQMLLRRIGVNHASLRLANSEGEETNYGVRTYDLWVLLIPSYEASHIATFLKKASRYGSRYGRNNAHPDGEKIDRARKQRVLMVEALPDVHDVYCFSEPQRHMGVFGNALTYQCLVETFPANHDDYDDYQKTLKYAYLYAKTVTLVPTHDPRVNSVMLRNRRIGTSQSGIAQSFQKHGRRTHFNWCDKGYKYLRRLDSVYSRWLCVPESNKITSVKPSGTVSLLAGATPGVHYPHSEYYIRNIRLEKDSQLAHILQEAGYHCEDDIYTPRTTVVSFPVHEQNFSRSKSDVSMFEQLEIAAQMQAYWADNQVSVTVTFTPEEAKQIGYALELYEVRLKGVSFLPEDGGGYKQAPYIEITKEQYEELASGLRPYDLTNISHEVTDKFCDGDKCVIPNAGAKVATVGS